MNATQTAKASGKVFITGVFLSTLVNWFLIYIWRGIVPDSVLAVFFGISLVSAFYYAFYENEFSNLQRTLFIVGWIAVLTIALHVPTIPSFFN